MIKMFSITNRLAAVVLGEDASQHSRWIASHDSKLWHILEKEISRCLQ